MIEEIKFSENLSIYRVNYNDIDNEQLSKELWFSTELYKMTHYPTPKEPGIQSAVLVNSKELNLIRRRKIDMAFSLFNKPFFYSIHEWIFISQNDNLYSGFHTHQSDASTKITKQKPDYTMTYYTKMPDNLEGDDGHIIFKDVDGQEYSILPKVGDLILFGADVLHRAATNVNSKDERMVFCTNFTFLDINKNYNKKVNTLI